MIKGLSIKTNKQGKQNIYISPKLNAKDGEVVIYYPEELKDLNNTDVTNSPEYIELQNKYGDYENKCKELSLKNEKRITEVKEFQKVKQDLIIKLETSENKIKQQEEIHKLELKVKNNTIANLNEKVTNLNDTLEDVSIKSNAKDERIKELEIRIKELDFNLHSQEEKITKTNEEFKNKDKEIGELKKVIDNVTTKSNSKDIQIKELELQEEQVKVLSEKLIIAENKLEDLNQVKVVMGGLVGYIKNIKWYNLLFSKSSLKHELSKVDKLLNTPELKSIDTYAVVKKED